MFFPFIILFWSKRWQPSKIFTAKHFCFASEQFRMIREKICQKMFGNNKQRRTQSRTQIAMEGYQSVGVVVEKFFRLNNSSSGFFLALFLSFSFSTKFQILLIF